AGQQVHRTNAAVGGRSGTIGNFVMDVRGRHDGLVTATIVVLVQSAGYLPLALFDLFSYLGTHSKASVRWVNVVLCTHHLTPTIAEGFRAFLFRNSSDPSRVRLARD